MTTSSFPLSFIEWPTRWSHSTSGAQGSIATFSLSTHKAAWVFQVPRDGTIDKFSIRINTVTTGDTLTGRIETLTVNSSNPSGTLLATGASGTRVITGADAQTWVEFVLGTPVAVTAGSVIAAVVSNGSVPGSMTLSRMAGSEPIPDTYTNVRNQAFTTSWAAPIQSGCLFALSYQGVGYIPLYNGFTFSPGTFHEEDLFLDSSNPDERGNLFVCPCDIEVSGIWLHGSGSNGDCRVRIYDSSSTVLAETNIDGVQQPEGGRNVYFDPIVLTRGASYRMTVKATDSVTTGIQIAYIQPGLGGSHPGGADWTKTTRNNDTGSWTDTANQRYQMGLQISGTLDIGNAERVYSSIN